MAPEESNSEDVTVCCLDEGSTSVLYALRVAESSWTVSLRGLKLDRNACPLLTTSPETVTSISDVSLILSKLCSCRVCAGNSDEKFLKLSYLRKGVFILSLLRELLEITRILSVHPWDFRMK